VRLIRLLAAAAPVLAVTAAPARADLTAFVGAQSSPSTRATTGVAVGSGILIVGFEVEYAQAGADDDCFSTTTCAPSVRTVMFNGLLQTPRHLVPRTQLYFTVGGGYFRERFESLDEQKTGAATNVGGGAKIDLAGPLRVRLDYRVFKLGSSAVYATPQRFSVGLNLAF
jgi:Outer membrane protein beta-barrel domain